MSNKYKEQIEKFKINDNIEEQITNKCFNNKYRFKLKYAYLFIALLLISFTIVNAEEISTFIRSLGTTTITNKNSDEKVELNEITTIKTNIDDIIINKDELDFYEDGEQITYYVKDSIKANNIYEINDALGINLLDIKNNTFEYLYSNFTDDFHIGSIFIKSLPYKISCESTCEWNDQSTDKFILLEANVYTSNYEDGIINAYEFGNNEDDFLKTNSKAIQNIKDLNINGIAIWSTINDDERNQTNSELYFNYNNVSYHFIGINLEADELINYIEENIL